MDHHREFLHARRRGPNYYGSANTFQPFYENIYQQSSYYNAYQQPSYYQGNSVYYPPYPPNYNQQSVQPNYGWNTNNQFNQYNAEQKPSQTKSRHVPQKRKGPTLPKGMNEQTSIGIPPAKKPVPVPVQPRKKSPLRQACKEPQVQAPKCADKPKNQSEKPKFNPKDEAIVPSSVLSPLSANMALKGVVTSTPHKQLQIKLFSQSNTSIIIVNDDKSMSKNADDSSGIGSLENAEISKTSDEHSYTPKLGLKNAVTSTPLIKSNSKSVESVTTPKLYKLPRSQNKSVKTTKKTNLQPKTVTDLNADWIILDEDKSMTGNSKNSSGIGSLHAPEDIIDLSGIHNLEDNSLLMAGLSLVCNANDTLREEMNATFEAELLSNMLEARESFYETQCQQPIPLNNVTPSAPLNLNNVYVIVDTNIFIDRLQVIINIMNLSYEDNSQPVIYVPWMVVQELDYFKDGYSVSTKHPISQEIQFRSRKAVKFMNECLIARKSNFKGQPVQRAAENRHKGHTADDSILGCCMQLFGEGYDVIMLTNDRNLRNKALISNIKAFAPNDIMQELKKKPARQRLNFVDEVSKKLSIICSKIVPAEMKDVYGERTFARKSFRSLPWRFRDCIRYLREHFQIVFHPRVPKQCRKVVDELHELLVVNEAIVNEVKFFELCLSLLIYFQNGLPKWEAKIQDTIEEVKQLERRFLR